MLKRPALIFQAGPKLIHLENKNREQMDTITGVSCLPDVSPEKRHLSVLSVISIISQTVLRLANAPKYTIKNLININSNIFLLSYSKLAIFLYYLSVNNWLLLFFLFWEKHLRESYLQILCVIKFDWYII